MKSLIKNISKEKLQEIVQNSISIDEALKKIGYTYTGGTNYELFKKTCTELNIDYSHFTGLPRQTEKRTIENVFCEQSTASQATLRKWYFEGDFSEYKCAICGINEWNGKKLTLRLDHINGVNKDNRLENLRWVCPNCDSQLETYCRGHKRIKNGQIKEKTYCENCGKEISKDSKFCTNCYGLQRRKVERPSREELKEMIRNSSFLQIGKKYNVSDNAIRKWCISENLPSTKKEIKSYSDEKWSMI